MKTFVTADTHFGHRNIIKFCDRPFANIHEHDEALISNWNEVVGRDDVVWHLGDFSNRSDPRRVFDRLNGRIHLILGNHDKLRLVKQCDFESIESLHTLKVDKKTRVVLSHFPFEIWDKKHHGSYHLHGHCHSNLPQREMRRRDVGVDNYKYYPVELERVLDYLSHFETHGRHR